MTEQVNSLKATTRQAGAKSAVRAVRREGLVPGVVYGHDVKDVLVSVDPRDLEAVLRTEYAYNAVFNLEIDGEGTHQVMVRDMQFDSVRRVVTHVDFKVVANDDKVILEVPVQTTGTAKGVTKGGRLDIVRRSVKIVTTVSEIPVAVIHDVTKLEIGDQVYIDEMKEPEGSKFEFNHRYPVIRVARRRAAAAGTETAAADSDDEDEDEDGEEGGSEE